MNDRASYLELIERDSKRVPIAWKVFSILFYLGAIISGILGSYFFSHFMDDVYSNCILYSDLTFNSSLVFNSTSITFDAANSRWGKASSCNYCLCVFIVSILFGLSWATFFLMCGRGGSTHQGLGRPWRIVYPALFFNAAYSVVCLTAAIFMTSGINSFCLNFKMNMHTDDCHDISLYDFGSFTSNYVSLSGLKIAESLAWVNAACWMLGFVTVFFRCLCAVDFELVHVSTTDPSKRFSRGNLVRIAAASETGTTTPSET